LIVSCLIASATGCSSGSRYGEDPDDVKEYQHVITLVGTAAVGTPLVVDFPLAGTDVDEAIATATAQWGHAPARASFYGLELSGRSGVCMLSVVAASGRTYPVGIAALPGDHAVTRNVQVLPTTPVSTDAMTADDAADVIAARASIRASCEPLMPAATAPTAFSLTGGFSAGR